MPLALDALWQKLISGVQPAPAGPHYPIYAENRRSHAPEVIQAPIAHSATGLTYPNDTTLTLGDRAALTAAGFKNGVGLDMEKFLATQAGKKPGPIYITPNSNNPADTDSVVKHETIHSILDNAGIGADKLQKFMDSNTQLTPVQHAFDASPADGDAVTELPAYMAQPSPYYQPSPEHKAAYLQAFLPWLRSQSPKAADQYQSLLSQ